MDKDITAAYLIDALIEMQKEAYNLAIDEAVKVAFECDADGYETGPQAQEIIEEIKELKQ